MQAKAFRFGRLSTSQFLERLRDLNQFLESVEVVGVPSVTSNDEEGTVMFVFFNEKPQPKPEGKKGTP
jgi:hypothetical protein